MQTFEELDLVDPVRRALAEEKYTTPTPIQARTIPAALEGRDVLGCAQTGTGKTAAFALPILDRLGRRNRKAQPRRPLALVLAPTRELAIQIGDSFDTYGRHLRLRHALVYGGVSQGQQVRAMKRGAHVLVATPGRLLDLMGQGHVELDALEQFVLDEADRMLDMGFLPDIRRIIDQLPDERQSLFFSATLSPRINDLAKRLLRDPVGVDVTPRTRSVDRIEQRVMFLEREAKRERLNDVLNGDGVDRALVFTRTKRGANMLAQRLSKGGISATAIHGNKSQAARQRALEAFRRKSVRVLVATDVAARGIDIDGITHVVNFDLPLEPENYVHRIGRTGRAGAEGVAVSFCTPAERSELQAIERLIGQQVPLAEGETRPEMPRGVPKGKPSRSKGRRRRGGPGPGRKQTGRPRPTRNRDEGDSGTTKPKRRRRRSARKPSASTE